VLSENVSFLYTNVVFCLTKNTGGGEDGYAGEKDVKNRSTLHTADLCEGDVVSIFLLEGVRKMRITIRLDPEVRTKLEELQRKKGFLTLSETIRYVISEFFERKVR
jgi:hypothetical protein